MSTKRNTLQNNQKGIFSSLRKTTSWLIIIFYLFAEGLCKIKMYTGTHVYIIVDPTAIWLCVKEKPEHKLEYRMDMNQHLLSLCPACLSCFSPWGGHLENNNRFKRILTFLGPYNKKKWLFTVTCQNELCCHPSCLPK